jgi:hypothetical protein
MKILILALGIAYATTPGDTCVQNVPEPNCTLSSALRVTAIIERAGKKRHRSANRKYRKPLQARCSGFCGMGHFIRGCHRLHICPKRGGGRL